MAIDSGQFFRACNPSKTLNLASPADEKYYIDFSAVRGSDMVQQLKRTITLSGPEPTCQLFTGHIGCGKSTELSRLQRELEAVGYQVVYFESTDDLDMGDVDISDILLAIAKQVSKSLEAAKLRLAPSRFQQLLKGTADLLNSEVTGLKVNVPEIAGVKLAGDVGISAAEGTYALSLGIGEITTKAKDSKDVRALLRQHLEPRIKTILDIINSELIDTANRFGASPQVLPMVRTYNYDGSRCDAGIDALHRMILARAFPDLPADQHLAQLGQAFDNPETLVSPPAVDSTGSISDKVL